MDLNELQIFVQVAKIQSFTAAAERLEIPKSSVSRAIRKLEGRLGLRLIERTTRRVALTEEGRIYFDRCERVLEDAEQAEIEIGALQAKPRGTLRVGTPGIFARYILGPALAEFLAAYPEVRVHLQSLDAISRERPLDVVVRPGPLEDSGFLAASSRIARALQMEMMRPSGDCRAAPWPSRVSVWRCSRNRPRGAMSNWAG
jgi:DNA-binding transcriptional LysR family regulator